MLLGGLTIFLYGMKTARVNLQHLAGERIRKSVALLTSNRIVGVTAGAVATVIMQSSGALIAMLVGLASAGTLALRQAIVLILGADIGTTFTVFLISTRITDYALLFITIGYALPLIMRSKRAHYVGETLIAFGMVFLGMILMKQAVTPLKDSPLASQILLSFSDNPGWGIFISALFTAMIMSSSAAIGLILSFALAGAVDLKAAIPLILGANIGTTMPALLAASSAELEGKRVAAAHLLMKVMGVSAFFFLMKPFAALVESTSSNLGYQIVMAHVYFNLCLNLIFFFLVSIVARVVCHLLPEVASQRLEVFRSKYLDDHALETPVLAFAGATREILRMADIAYDMFWACIDVLRSNDRALLEEIEAKDDQIDLLNRDVKLYLAKLTETTLSERDASRVMELINLSTILEALGDVINKQILELAEKKISKGLGFSAEGFKELNDYHRRVMETFRLAISAYTTSNEELARQVVRQKEKLKGLEHDYRQTHIERLRDRRPESIETTSIHIDLIASFRRINSLYTALAYEVLKAPGTGISIAADVNESL